MSAAANKALAGLLRDSEEWREFFRQCCAHGSRRLRAQARRQFREELAHQGHAFSPAEVEDAALIAARKLLPNTPAAEWNAEHADQLCKEAMTRMSECFAKLSADEKDRRNLDGQGDWHDRMYRAGIDNDSAAFREALEGWERAGLETLADLRRKGAA